ncbi:hypothetical protein TZ54_08800 [Clostridioides difficile]|nr:SH3 domain-containing protein [Clostridioides difficile]KJF63591.1 hypothetical protein TZ54_08800 [Clostridioides difficile]
MKLTKLNIKKYRAPIYKYALANVNLRSAKSTNSSIITVIPQGAKMEVLDEEDDWIKVMYNSQEGYVYKDLVSVSEYAWSNLNLREDKSTTSNIITVIPEKSRVEVLQVDGIGVRLYMMIKQDMFLIIFYQLMEINQMN